MKKSLNAWTVEGSLGFEETFRAVAEAGFDGIELNLDGSGPHSITMATTADDYRAIRALAEKYAYVTFIFNGGVEEPNKG